MTSYYEDLAMSLLAVNSYPLEKVYPLQDKLREHGLFSPEQVNTWSHNKAVEQLEKTGFDRGATMNSIFAGRLQELAFHASQGDLEEVWEAVRKGPKKKAEAALLKLRGVGRVVVKNFWILQG